MALLLVNRNAEGLTVAAEALAGAPAVETMVADVSGPAAMKAVAARAFAMGEVGVVMLNAGISRPSTAWGTPEAWDEILPVNFHGILNGVQAFVPGMLEAGRPAAVICTGSKQGIATPPGNPAYNVSKAAVKALTEQLSHELREAGAPVTAHLFVPGFAFTGMTGRETKPDGAWTAGQTVEHLFHRLAKGAFHVLCPDNMATPEIDRRRETWPAGDITEDRPALSRRRPDWAEKFAAFQRGE